MSRTGSPTGEPFSGLSCHPFDSVLMSAACCRCHRPLARNLRSEARIPFFRVAGPIELHVSPFGPPTRQVM